MNDEQSIVIKFRGLGSSLFDLELNGQIFANQLFVLSHFFEFQGKQMLNEQRLAQIMQDREAPEGKILTPDQARKKMGL